MKLNSETDQTGYLVIGAGLPRTGTSSTKVALEEILSGECYHMSTVFRGGVEETDHWNQALEDLKRSPDEKLLKDQDWIDFLQGRGFRAGVDFPVSIFYKSVSYKFTTVLSLLFSYTMCVAA